MKTIHIKEHQNLYHDDEFKKLSDEQKSDIEEQKQNSELFQKNGYSAEKKERIVGAYHIGIDWLIENELALIVNPKIKGLDYLKMFMTCFNHPEVSNEINKNRGKNGEKPIYNIDLDKKAISLKTPRFEITPLIIIHFVKVLEKVVKRGLKQDYIRREENLSSKIKGKIMFSKHLKKNVMMGRKDRVFCNYQDYSVDCLENQVLKKALVFCKNYLSKNFKKTTLKTIDQTVMFCQSAFGQVSDIKQVSQLKQFKVNKLYRDYDEALKLAKIILKRFGYNFQESQKEESKIPPFWIDMALLFEMYVLAKLKDQYKGQILYQVQGAASGIPDFLKIDEQMIIDAKYKENYGKDIYDIRQLSGYARDTDILKKLGIEEENTVLDCLIIYPNQEDGIKDFESDQLLNEAKKEPIGQFTKFYKVGMQLPRKSL